MYSQILVAIHVLTLAATVIFRVYDSDGNGKVTLEDILEVLRDLTGSFISEEQRQVIKFSDSI